ncbi:hypothetical protein GGTG_05733 [Gaeumannomyces tritici R3-111a-1]|uniref:Uncharacterized protein n=1 Tax=Gaeumannomyces tritici (strain R3-111a-1) TaxID=644352 RepID=J3NWS2_GAET3|nr:hypothetical protein GGTG_05733 [Gaeumannomyces tritici R3-111a-1]EJT75804.1 hypothetical protein GGTG_05733 [Gaeumannomyces tritici R3-111a-1]
MRGGEWLSMCYGDATCILRSPRVESGPRQLEPGSIYRPERYRKGTWLDAGVRVEVEGGQRQSHGQVPSAKRCASWHKARLGGGAARPGWTPPD